MACVPQAWNRIWIICEENKVHSGLSTLSWNCVWIIRKAYVGTYVTDGTVYGLCTQYVWIIHRMRYAAACVPYNQTTYGLYVRHTRYAAACVPFNGTTYGLYVMNTRYAAACVPYHGIAYGLYAWLARCMDYAPSMYGKYIELGWIL